MKLLTFTLSLLIFLSGVSYSPLSAQIRKKKKNKKNVDIENILFDTLEIYPFNAIEDYKGSYTQNFDLIHTELNVKPIFSDRTIQGTVTLRLHPHFYDQSEIVIDAKGMKFDSITWSIDRFAENLNYAYDGLKLKIPFQMSLGRKDTFEIKIQYTAYPYELSDYQKQLGQGAYFINSNHTNPYRTTMFWTQGETEASSCWFPTLDAGNQKTTQDIFVTVPDTMVSISNGILVEQTLHPNGTRTDHWQLNLKHAPYLTALVIGAFEKIHDLWENKDVDYYCLAPYKNSTYEVFKRTPEMIDFFSSILGYGFPWDNYKQVAVYDFVSGAMENTTLSIFHQGLMMSKNQLWNKRWGEDLIIAHELFHQWFGDLVTCESWSQLTLNESFARYGEYLWLEKWKGKEDAEAHRYDDFNRYLREYSYIKVDPIVQNYYESPRELFDRHRYEKGGLVLNLLREIIGDDAFFTGVQEYLKTNAFQSAEVTQLRLAFEKVTGQDLNWFFDQWFYHPGHPIVEISSQYDTTHHEVVMDFYQKQDQHPNNEIPIYKILLPVDFIYPDTIIRHQIAITRKKSIERIASETPPLAINFDPGKQQIWEALHNYSTEELSVIYNRTKDVLDKVYVIQQLNDRLLYDEAAKILLPDFESQHWFVQENIMQLSIRFNKNDQLIAIQKMRPLLKSEVAEERNNALNALIDLNDSLTTHFWVYELLVNDSSYSVKSTCLDEISRTDNDTAYALAQKYFYARNNDIEKSISKIIASHPEPENLSYFERSIYSIHPAYTRGIYESFEKYLTITDDSTFKKGIDILVNIIQNEYPNNRVKYAKNLLQKLRTESSQVLNENKKEHLIQKGNFTD